MQVLSGVRAGWLLAGLAGACAWGQATTALIEPPPPLLQGVGATIEQEQAKTLLADKRETAAVLKEDGLQRMEVRGTSVPVQAGAVTSGWVAAYEFSDATGAFAAYTYLRQGGRLVTSSQKVNATEVSLPDGELVFLTGTNVVRAKVKQYPESVDGLLRKVSYGLPKVGGRRGLAPLLPALLPKASLDLASVRYALGPAGYAAMGGVLPAGDLGWDKSAEVATADYFSGKGSLTVLLYPTPQIAGDRGRAIEKDVNAAGAGKMGLVKMRRVGPLVGVTSGGFSEVQAKALVDSLKLDEQVTFDQKMPLEFHAEVRKTYTLLQSISVFCGIGILAAVVLAVFLGGARAGIRVLQGKPAASEPEFLSINLRGSSREKSEKDEKG